MSSAIKKLDIPTLVPSNSNVEAKKGIFSLVSTNTPLVSTDWNWMLSEASKSGLKRSVQDEIAKWSADRGTKVGKPRWATIEQRMRSFVHRHIYSLTLADFKEAYDNTIPPLQTLKGKDGKLKAAEDFNSAVPLNLIFHSLTEQNRQLPTFQVFMDYLKAHPNIMMRDIHAMTKLPVSVLEGNWLGDRFLRAMRYRLGTAFLSYLREQHFMITMREEYGIHLAHHFMLDIHWKIDFLWNGIALELYLASKQFKDNERGQQEGRKIPCVQMNPHRAIIEVPFRVRRDSASYNKPWLIVSEHIERTAMRLRACDCDHRGVPIKL